MKAIKLNRYSTPKNFNIALEGGYLKINKEGLLLDLGGVPANYEVIVRDMKNQSKEQIVYQNVWRME